MERLWEEQILATDISFAEYLEQFAGQYAEWVNGVVVAMSPIDRKHDKLARFLATLLGAYFDRRPVGLLREAPTTMRLGKDLPAREPDLLVLLNEHAERDTDTYVEGPADWVIEIVSPESGARDRGTKFDEYERGGVSEYWIIDPHRRELWAYRRGEDGLYQSLPVDEEGCVTSVTLPDFRLETALLWQTPLPGVHACIEIVRKMLEG